MTEKVEWVVAGRVGDIPEDGAIPFDFGAETFAIYRTQSGYYATEGFCTHAASHLADGYVDGEVIECQMHQGRFDIRTGKPLSPPVTIALKTYSVRIDGDQILIGIPTP